MSANSIAVCPEDAELPQEVKILRVGITKCAIMQKYNCKLLKTVPERAASELFMNYIIALQSKRIKGMEK